MRITNRKLRRKIRKALLKEAPTAGILPTDIVVDSATGNHIVRSPKISNNILQFISRGDIGVMGNYFEDVAIVDSLPAFDKGANYYNLNDSINMNNSPAADVGTDRFATPGCVSTADNINYTIAGKSWSVKSGAAISPDFQTTPGSVVQLAAICMDMSNLIKPAPASGGIPKKWDPILGGYDGQKGCLASLADFLNLNDTVTFKFGLCQYKWDRAGAGMETTTDLKKTGKDVYAYSFQVGACQSISAAIGELFNFAGGKARVMPTPSSQTKTVTVTLPAGWATKTTSRGDPTIPKQNEVFPLYYVGDDAQSAQFRKQEIISANIISSSDPNVIDPNSTLKAKKDIEENVEISDPNNTSVKIERHKASYYINKTIKPLASPVILEIEYEISSFPPAGAYQEPTSSSDVGAGIFKNIYGIQPQNSVAVFTVDSNNPLYGRANPTLTKTHSDILRDYFGYTSSKADAAAKRSSIFSKFVRKLNELAMTPFKDLVIRLKSGNPTDNDLAYLKQLYGGKNPLNELSPVAFDSRLAIIKLIADKGSATNVVKQILDSLKADEDDANIKKVYDAFENTLLPEQQVREKLIRAHAQQVEDDRTANNLHYSVIRLQRRVFNFKDTTNMFNIFHKKPENNSIQIKVSAKDDKKVDFEIKNITTDIVLATVTYSITTNKVTSLENFAFSSATGFNATDDAVRATLNLDTLSLGARYEDMGPESVKEIETNIEKEQAAIAAIPSIPAPALPTKMLSGTEEQKLETVADWVGSPAAQGGFDADGKTSVSFLKDLADIDSFVFGDVTVSYEEGINKFRELNEINALKVEVQALEDMQALYSDLLAAQAAAAATPPTPVPESLTTKIGLTKLSYVTQHYAFLIPMAEQIVSGNSTMKILSDIITVTNMNNYYDACVEYLVTSLAQINILSKTSQAIINDTNSTLTQIQNAKKAYVSSRAAVEYIANQLKVHRDPFFQEAVRKVVAPPETVFSTSGDYDHNLLHEARVGNFEIVGQSPTEMIDLTGIYKAVMSLRYLKLALVCAQAVGDTNTINDILFTADDLYEATSGGLLGNIEAELPARSQQRQLVTTESKDIYERLLEKLLYTAKKRR